MAVLPFYDQVCILKETPFSRWSEDDKKDFLNCKKPTPHLDVNKEAKWKDKVCVRKFKLIWYSQFDWLCGSYYLKKLFCLPCLIISTKIGVWNSSGFGDFGNVSRSLHKHESSSEHLRCAFNFKQLKRNLSTTQDLLTENSRLDIQKFNENVLLNRRLMELLIRTTVFLAKQQIDFQGHHDHVSADMRGNFEELLESFVDVSPSDIKEQYKKNSSLFKDNSKTIQKELINCISFYIDEHVRKEIKQCDFLYIQVDDATDLCQKSQCSVILRYVVSGGNVKERFLGFHDVSSDRTANNLFNIVLNCLEMYNCKSKLVAQSYDGAIVTAEHLEGLQTRVKEVAPQAVFVHCLAHRLSLVLEQSCYSISKCRIFFASVNGFSSFIDHSVKCTQVADTSIGKKILTAVVTKWASNLNVISVINDEWESLKQLFTEIITNQTSDQTSVRQSRYFLKEFNDFDFALLVVIFSEIFTITDDLFDVLQKNSFDIKYCISHITEHQQLIEQKRNKTDFRRMFDLAMLRATISIENFEECSENKIFENYKDLFYDILDTILHQITLRFADLNKIKFVTLMDSSKFTTFFRNFPTDAMDNLKEFYYPNIFNEFQLQRLKSELQLVYTQYQETDPSNLMEKLSADSDIFKETYKLFSLILTLPSTNVSAERSFFCLKRIKTYLRNTREERLSNLAKISIEKELLDELITTQPFHSDIINKYAALKDRRIDLILKK